MADRADLLRQGGAAERGAEGSVRRARPGDEESLRSLRLQALSDAPEAFDSTLERERARTIADWQRWFTHGATFVFETPDGLKGIAAGVPHDSDPSAAFLMSVWVHPDLRGTGAADALIASVLAWARSAGLADVWLQVGKYNEQAQKLYERNGFRPTGSESVRERDGVLELEMRCALGPQGDGDGDGDATT
jgi:ribosomal protein S18 acetylase RimI-like enzyme